MKAATAVSTNELEAFRVQQSGVHGEKPLRIAMIVTTWPRLSQTFVLREFLGLESMGAQLRIFSVKVPQNEPVHAEVKKVRASVTYLAFKHALGPILAANLKMMRRNPRRYFASWILGLRSLRYGNVLHVIRQMLRAGYVAEALMKNPVDRIHAHFATAPGSIAMFASELTGVPFSIAVHANDIFVKARGKLMRTKMKRADAIVTNNQFNRRYLLSEFGPAIGSKLPCIYNGLQLGEFQFRSDRPDSGSLPVILSIGRLVEKKGLTYLISAAAILRDRGHRFRLEIIGDGPVRSRLQEQITALHLEALVELLGAQGQDSARAAYHRAAIFVLPCVVTSAGDRDGIPNVLYEAMASGTPVISTPVAGIPELIQNGQNGSLVDQRDPEALAEKIALLLNDPSGCESLAREARRTIESRFTLERTSRELLQLFRTLRSQSKTAMG